MFRLMRISAASMALVAGGAFAQEQDESDIIVTAQKREQSTQDVPIAINVLSGDALNDLGVKRTEDLARYVPNLSIRKTKGENYPTVTIRGVGLATGDVNYATSTSSTALHVDEVYFGSPTMMGFQIFDIQRVEVLKGPQGTLYGRNSTAGSINYVTQRPSHEPEGRVGFEWSDQNVFSSEGFVTGGLTDSVAARFAYTMERGDSYQKDLNGRHWPGPRRFATRTSLLMEPSDSLDILLTASTGQDNSGIGRTHLRGISDDVWVADGNVFGRYNIDFYGATAKIDWDLSGGLSLASVTSYNHVKARLPDEFDGEAIELQDSLYLDKVGQFSQELRLSGTGDRLNWVAGGYFFSERIKSQQFIDYFVDFYNPGDPRPGVKYNGAQGTDAYAAFGQVEYEFIDRLTLTLGLRYSHEKKKFRVSNYFNSFVAGALDVTDFDPASGYFYRNLNERDRRSWSDLSGKIGLNYKVDDDVMVYASVSNGFKSGGYLGSVTITRDAVHSPGAPEDLTSYEAGIKAMLLDRKLRLNAAAFYYDYKNMQAESIVFEGIVPFQALVNVQKVRVQGIDMDLAIYPTKGVELTFGLGYIDGVHKTFVTDTADYSGSRILNAPKWSVTSGVRWEVGRLLSGDFVLSANHSYNSAIDFNFTDRSLGSAGYHMFDARFAYTHEATGIEVALWGKNLTNRKVRVHAADRGDGGISELYLPGRRLGISANIPF
jgi:iron complex outermembrane receptor protein